LVRRLFVAFHILLVEQTWLTLSYPDVITLLGCCLKGVGICGRKLLEGPGALSGLIQMIE
jgi:hypothetical protein